MAKCLLSAAVVTGWDDTSTVEGPAAVHNVSVAGDSQSPIKEVEAVIILYGPRFAAIAADTDVSSWFVNLPAGLTARVKNAVRINAVEIFIAISGTPAAGSARVMDIVIPANRLVGGGDPVTVAPNPKANYDVTATIKNAADLRAFSEAVAAGDYRLNAALADSTTVIKTPANAPFLPIARDKNHPYAGVFNGNGGTIDLDLSDDAGFLALFGISNGGVINLTVTGKVAAAKGKRGADYVAAVVAYNDFHGSIEQVVSKVTVSADPSIRNVGGIAGFNGMDLDGGNSPHAKDEDYQEGGYLNRCRNEGNIAGGGNNVGGIAGGNAGTISECVNTGAIRCGTTGEHEIRSGAGGIAGCNGGDTAEGHLENCYNRGEMSGQAGAKGPCGGIIGWSGRFSTAKGCYATGGLPRDRSNPVIGAVAEDREGVSDNNYALDTISRSSTDEDLTGIIMTEAQMKDPDFVSDINDTDDFGPYAGVKGDYPKLKWELGIEE
jgi:hypothetical protein